ncbi:MAG: ComEC/Rec2 family competence protein, partial [Clostridia bacterium]|nr:ComEC/Rec2 family competence protein [Clostridia bacterium]
YEFIFALLTGDTNFVSDITLTRFRDVGVAHIFAVSGLHIGFLYGFVTLILKPVKIKAFIKYIITLIILFLYVIFCGLTPSCLRAFIIIAVSNFARSFGFKNDKLSSVFFSMFIVLSINSSDLFNIGFHLSFVACLSLIFLTPKIEKLLNFILPNKISQFASPYISAYLGTLPIVTDCFSNSTAFSMIFNAVIVPFMSFIFILSFVSSIIILIFSNLLFIMQISSFFVGIIIYIVNTFSFIVLLKITVVFSVSVVFYYFELVLFAGLINLKRKTVKYLYVINFALFLTVFLVINVLHLY